MVTLQFSCSRSIAASAIRFGTWSWCSHVDLVLPDGSLLGAIPGGVQIHRLEEPARVERFRVAADEGAVVAAMQSQLGRPYDWDGILGWTFRRDWQEEDSWFCSELVAWAFQQAGNPLLRAECVHRITPRDLLLSPLLQSA